MPPSDEREGALLAAQRARPTPMTIHEFRLRDETIQLDQLLKVMGLTSSGGAAHAAVEAGQVQVDGQVELRKRAKLRAGQRVQFAGQEIVLKEPAAK